MTAEDRIHELALHYESRMGKVDDLRPVKARVARQVRNVFSLRIGAGELDAIADAAERRGVSVGDFIRQAALKEAARGDADAVESKLDEILRTTP